VNDDEEPHNVTGNERTPAADAAETCADLAFNLEERIRQHDELRDCGDFPCHHYAIIDPIPPPPGLE
jgi:hypothetical protein